MRVRQWTRDWARELRALFGLVSAPMNTKFKLFEEIMPRHRPLCENYATDVSKY